MRKSILYLTVLGGWLVFGSPASASLEEGLIGYWPLNGDALDHSGSGYHGILLDGAGFVDNPTGAGRVLQSTQGGKNYGHVKVSLPVEYHTQNGETGHLGSGAVWVWFDDRKGLLNAPNWQGILGQPPGLLYVDRLLKRDNVYAMLQRSENSSSNKNFWPRTPEGSLALEGRWYHIAWTFHAHHSGETGHFRWYINGHLSAEDMDGVQTIGTGSFRIGADYAGYSTNTKLAEVRLYDRILSPSEIQELCRLTRFAPLPSYPLWWQIPYESSLEDAYQHGTPEADHAPLVLGQLKYLAAQGREELGRSLASLGGAGEELDQMVNNFGQNFTTDHAPALIGQLKNVSAKFFDRFAEVGFQPGESGWPTGLNLDPLTAYPWANNQTPNNLAPVNLGQAKHLFSWDVQTWITDAMQSDTDSDGLPDFWEEFHFGNLDQDGAGDADGDGMINSLEYELQCNPNNADTDGDEMEDMFEYFYDLKPTSSTSYFYGPDGDYDNDSLTNLEEFQQGSIPNSPGEYLQVLIFEGLRVQWFGVRGHYYFIEFKTDFLAPEWSVYNKSFIGDNLIFAEAVDDILPSPSPTGFFRLRIQNKTVFIDTDNDRLPDWWEQTHFSNLNQSTDGDPDGDGILNRYEWEAATDPTVDQTLDSEDPGLMQFSYDALGQLTRSDGFVNLNYVFDDEGNLEAAN